MIIVFLNKGFLRAVKVKKKKKKATTTQEKLCTSVLESSNMTLNRPTDKCLGVDVFVFKSRKYGFTFPPSAVFTAF